MEISFRKLRDMESTEFLELMNNPLVRAHLPLATTHYDEQDYENFVADKEAIWRQNGYGPWAFYVDYRFAGWGGLQPEDGYPDFALVLSPQFWGIGSTLFRRISTHAFREMELKAITVLLPQSRTQAKALSRLGFKAHGEVKIGTTMFNRYLLKNPADDTN